MNTTQLIYEIERLPVEKRMYVIEQAIRSLRIMNEKQEMEKAAELLRNDYEHDGQLTEFTNLDFEDFYEAR